VWQKNKGRQRKTKRKGGTRLYLLGFGVVVQSHLVRLSFPKQGDTQVKPWSTFPRTSGLGLSFAIGYSSMQVTAFIDILQCIVLSRI